MSSTTAPYNPYKNPSLAVPSELRLNIHPDKVTAFLSHVSAGLNLDSAALQANLKPDVVRLYIEVGKKRYQNFLDLISTNPDCEDVNGVFLSHVDADLESGVAGDPITTFYLLYLKAAAVFESLHRRTLIEDSTYPGSKTAPVSAKYLLECHDPLRYGNRHQIEKQAGAMLHNLLEFVFSQGTPELERELSSLLGEVPAYQEYLESTGRNKPIEYDLYSEAIMEHSDLVEEGMESRQSRWDSVPRFA